MLALRTALVAWTVFVLVWGAVDRLAVGWAAWAAAERQWRDGAWLRAQCADPAFGAHMARADPGVCVRAAARGARPPLLAALGAARASAPEWPLPGWWAAGAALVAPAAAHAAWALARQCGGRRARRLFKERDLFSQGF